MSSFFDTLRLHLCGKIEHRYQVLPAFSFAKKTLSSLTKMAYTHLMLRRFGPALLFCAVGVFKSKNQAIVKSPFTNKAALFSLPHCCLVAWFFVAEAVFQVMVAKVVAL